MAYASLTIHNIIFQFNINSRKLDGYQVGLNIKMTVILLSMHT